MAQFLGHRSPPPPETPGYDNRYTFAFSQLSFSAQGYLSSHVSPAPYYGSQPAQGYETWQGRNHAGYNYPNDNTLKNAPYRETAAGYQPMGNASW
ncbi:hypothetical protein BKA67DRAFT_566834 [Truncatella angustata]|uniref:Uncharacterized protein n=1 Tax=Truncatella angustata TaxID=152316 RepID=A0A9P8ZW23_9PEZI|nr:uncharacterized protein BKA67DRAFT_566834 [Truncatella angustata]KAH6652532.1 hypothetical protein BKA67DRAFT_566834 [Truncatella angustata]